MPQGQIKINLKAILMQGPFGKFTNQWVRKDMDREKLINNKIKLDKCHNNL